MISVAECRGGASLIKPEKSVQVHIKFQHTTLILLGSVRLLGIILGVNSLHLENGLKCHLNERKRRILQFQKGA